MGRDGTLLLRRQALRMEDVMAVILATALAVLALYIGIYGFWKGWW